MESKENVLIHADIQYIKPKRAKIATRIYLILVALILACGMISGTDFYQENAYNFWEDTYVPFNSTEIGWFGEPFYRHRLIREETYFDWMGEYRTTTEERTDTYTVNIVKFVVAFAFLFSLPAIISGSRKHRANSTALTITDSQVTCSYYKFLSKKMLNSPIERVDSFTSHSGVIDQYRSGATLTLRTSSESIKLHYVQNVQEVIDAAMGCIHRTR